MGVAMKKKDLTKPLPVAKVGSYKTRGRKDFKKKKKGPKKKRPVMATALFGVHLRRNTDPKAPKGAEGQGTERKTGMRVSAKTTWNAGGGKTGAETSRRSVFHRGGEKHWVKKGGPSRNQQTLPVIKERGGHGSLG